MTIELPTDFTITIKSHVSSTLNDMGKGDCHD